MPFDAAMPVEGHDYLDSVKTRHGKWLYYVRVSRKAKRIALPGHPDASPENKLAYHRALAIALAGKEVFAQINQNKHFPESLGIIPSQKSNGFLDRFPNPSPTRRAA